MADNHDRRNQKTVWDILPALAMIGSVITAWVNLNGELTQVQIQQEYSEKFNSVKIEELQKDLTTIKQSIAHIKTTDAELQEQLSDMERTVTHIYSTNKR